MKKLLTLLLVLLSVTTMSAATKAVFLYAGQSNADGREYVQNLPDYMKQGTSPYSPYTHLKWASICGNPKAKTFGTRQMSTGERYAFCHVPEDEVPMLTELNRSGFRAFYDEPVENRRQCMMSYDFHITHGDRLLLVNHKITPLAMTTEGRVWLALCTVSLSPHKEAGHIEFFQFHTGEKREYSLEAHRWKSRETITLKPEEKQILTLSAQGYTMKEIAEKMLRSFDTVKFYRRQIFEKLDVQNITEALALATNYGLV